MKKILLIALICTIIFPAFAENYIQIANNSYIDNDTIMPYIGKYEPAGSGKISFWIKNKNDKSASFDYLEKSLKKEVSYQTINFVTDCRNKQIATKSILAYDMSGDIISDYSAPSLQFTNIEQNSKEEVYYSYVCAID